VAVLGAVLLLTNTTLPGLQAFASGEECNNPVAKIWDIEYCSLQKAIENSNSWDEIKVLVDVEDWDALFTTESSNAGWVCISTWEDPFASDWVKHQTWPKNFTIDFQWHTYDIKQLAWSCWTPNQAIHFEKWTTSVLKNWIITSDEALLTVHNYWDMTLENMEIHASETNKYW